IIKLLISQGRLIDAVHFVQAFNFTENFPPAPLLRTYLKEVREDLQRKWKSSGTGDKHK
ncbi:hypothetical protein MKW94_023276, partial [Papaver nudicaule]|nr:hypothetical protein [Papaver nudicaule]